MKNIKVITLVILFSFIASTTCFSNNDYGDKNKKVKNKISRFLDFPDFAKQNKIEGEVVVDISINELGNIDIKQIDGHPKFQKYVIGQLSKINFKPDEDMVGKSLLYKFVFK